MVPPSTPAQPRFLLPKRQTQQPATPLQPGPQQFASPPRFHVPSPKHRRTNSSLSTHPKPLLLFTTPAAAPFTFRTAQQIDEDIIDTSPVSEEFATDGNHQKPLPSLTESIESEHSACGSADDDDLEDVQVERPSKRRRASVSPSEDEMSVYNEARIDESPPAYGHSTTESIHSDHPENGVIKSMRQPASSPTASDYQSDSAHVTDRHPTFLEAPRYKPMENMPESRSRQYPLPEAFSPQRRGAKYVPGGLAAELRDWLVQVKGASEYDRPAGAKLQLTVDEVSCETGSRMRLVATSVDVSDVRQQGAREDGSLGGPARFILAGEGRSIGLGRPNVVQKGGQVVLYQPMWDVDVGEILGHFAVACDWEVLPE